MTNLVKSLIVIPMILLFTACGSGGGGSSYIGGGSNDDATGQFIDDAVEGLEYSCTSGRTGITNSNGNYTCNTGDDVTFKVGNATIGTLAAQSDFFTPYSFFPTSVPHSLNLASLLQSLDSDGDADNGVIVIDTTLANALSPDTDFTSPTFIADTEARLGITLVSHTEAQHRLNENIEAHGGIIHDGGNVPIANAGLDQSAHTGDDVTLDGSSSIDIDGREISYTWELISKPTGSNSALLDTTIVNPTFNVDVAGEYVAALTVNNGNVDSVVDTVKITIADEIVPPIADEIVPPIADEIVPPIADEIVPPIADEIVPPTADGIVDIKEYIIPSSGNPTSYPMRVSIEGYNIGDEPLIYNEPLIINSDYTNYVAYDVVGAVFTWDFESGTGTVGPYTFHFDSQTSSFAVGDIIGTDRSEEYTLDVRLYDVIDDTIIIERYYESTDYIDLSRITYKKGIGYIYEIVHFTNKGDSTQDGTAEFSVAYED